MSTPVTNPKLIVPIPGKVPRRGIAISTTKPKRVATPAGSIVQVKTK